MNHYVIKHKNGSPMYEGFAKHRKAFVQKLVEDGLSLSGADLRRWRLDHIDLSGADLSEALLAQADLRGTVLEKANLREADLVKTEMSAVVLTSAHLQGADLTDAKMNSAIATWASFRGAKIHGTDFSDIDASSTVFSHCLIERASFQRATMHNADFGNSRVVECDFSAADLTATGPLDESNLPDRTRNSLIVGCTYDKETKLPERGMQAMKRDRAVGRIASAALWTASTGTVAAVLWAVLPEQVIEGLLQDHFGTGMGFVGVLSVATILRDGIADFAKEHISERLHKLQIKVREAIKSMTSRVANLHNMVIAIGQNFSLAPLRNALASSRSEAESKGIFGAFRYLTSKDLGSFIVCDRRHLALALGALSANRNRGYKLHKEVVLVRAAAKDNSDDHIPSAIRFHKDGQTTVVWQTNGEPSTAILYDADGQPLARLDLETGRASTEVDDVPDAESIFRATAAFEKRILQDHGLEDFVYPEQGHYVQSGMDGSILVYRTGNRRLSNPVGPAVITPDGTRHYYRNGVKIDEAAATGRMRGRRPIAATVEAEAEALVPTVAPDAEPVALGLR